MLKSGSTESFSFQTNLCIASFSQLSLPVFKLLPGTIERNAVASDSRHPVGGDTHRVFQNEAARNDNSAQTPIGFAEQHIMNFAELVSVARFDRQAAVDGAFGRRK